MEDIVCVKDKLKPHQDLPLKKDHLQITTTF